MRQTLTLTISQTWLLVPMTQYWIAKKNLKPTFGVLTPDTALRSNKPDAVVAEVGDIKVAGFI